MKMTREKAIKEWAKANREGRPIPENVRAVLLATQSDRVHTPLVVPAKLAKVNPAQVQINQKDKLSREANKTSSLSASGFNGAMVAEQMEAYNQKRKTDSLKRNSNTTRYSTLKLEFMASGLTETQATRKANDIIRQENVAKSNKKGLKSKHKGKSHLRANKLTQEEKIKSDAWYAAKVKQDAISKAKLEGIEFERNLSLRPISCIECKQPFKSFNGFLDHTRNIHKKSISTPKLVKIESSVEAILPVILATEVASVELKTAFEVTSGPKEKTQESFIDKWIRLFAEKGYSFPVVEAFKREASKQGMEVKEIQEFIEVCKPTKSMPVTKSVKSTEDVKEYHLKKTASETPKKQLIASAELTESEAITPGTANIVRAPVIAHDSSPYVIKCIRGEKIEINTTGRNAADQAVFRKAIANNYSYRCCITGDSIAIEAAHIQTHSDHYDNCIDNGIMLSVGLHRLFDQGLMIIDPESMTIHFTVDCFYKKHLEGKVVSQGRVKINKDKLRQKNRATSK